MTGPAQLIGLMPPQVHRYLSRESLNSTAMIYIYKNLMRAKMKYYCYIWAECCLFLSVLTEFKHVNAAFWVMNYFSPYIRCYSLLYRYCYGKCSNVLHSLVPQIRTFTARTDHILFTASNHPHSCRAVSCKELLLSETDSCEDASPTTTIF